MSFLDQHLNEVFDLESAYPFEVGKDTGLYQSYIFSDDSGNNYQLMFTNLAVLGKRVQSIRLGQQVPGGKYYKPLIKKVSNPYALIATIIAIFRHHTLETSKGKLKQGFAFGIPVSVFGAYAGLAKKIIFRELRTKWNGFDSPYQVDDDQYTKDLQFVYMVSKTKTPTAVFNGPQGEALLKGEVPQADDKKDAPEVATKADVPVATASDEDWKNMDAKAFVAKYNGWHFKHWNGLPAVVTDRVKIGKYFVPVSPVTGANMALTLPSEVENLIPPPGVKKAAPTEKKFSELTSKEFADKYKGMFYKDGTNWWEVVGTTSINGVFFDVKNTSNAFDTLLMRPNEIPHEPVVTMPKPDDVYAQAADLYDDKFDQTVALDDATKTGPDEKYSIEQFVSKYKGCWVEVAFYSGEKAITGKIGDVYSKYRFILDENSINESDLGIRPDAIVKFLSGPDGVKFDNTTSQPTQNAPLTDGSWKDMGNEEFVAKYLGWSVKINGSGAIDGHYIVSATKAHYMLPNDVMLDKKWNSGKYEADYGTSPIPSITELIPPSEGSTTPALDSSKPWLTMTQDEFLAKYVGWTIEIKNFNAGNMLYRVSATKHKDQTKVNVDLIDENGYVKTDYAFTSIENITAVHPPGAQKVLSKEDQWKKEYPLGTVVRLNLTEFGKGYYAVVVSIKPDGVLVKGQDGKDHLIVNPHEQIVETLGNINNKFGDLPAMQDNVKLASLLHTIGVGTNVKVMKDVTAANPIDYTPLSKEEKDFLALNNHVFDVDKFPVKSIAQYREKSFSDFTIGPLKFDYNGNVADFAHSLNQLEFLPEDQKKKFVAKVMSNYYVEEEAYLELKSIIKETNNSAALNYTGSDYTSINNVLRAKSSDSYGLSLIKSIDEAFLEDGIRFDSDTTLYRSQKMYIGDLRKLIAGQELVMYGYTSATTKMKFALSWKNISIPDGARAFVNTVTALPDTVKDSALWRCVMIFRGLDNTLALYPGSNGKHKHECEMILHRSTKVVLDNNVVNPVLYDKDEEFFIINLRVVGTHKTTIAESFGKGFRMFSENTKQTNKVINEINTGKVVPTKAPEEYEGSERWHDDAFDNGDKEEDEKPKS